MISISLVDGGVKTFDTCYVTGSQIVLSISQSLAKRAVAMEVNGCIRDLSEVVADASVVRVITAQDPEGLEIIRHDAAHVLAQAAKRLYPDVQVAIGPVIQDGFYYDFARKESFSENDLAAIESVMHDIFKEDLQIKKERWTRDQVIRYFSEINEVYKIQIVQSIGSGEDLTIYRQGEFVDLCKGPHSSRTGMVAAFKLLRVSGAYWRGDSNNEMLQRIYGTAWDSKQNLDNYLKILEDSKERDHRKIGKQMGLFHFQDESRGGIFWHEKGWIIYMVLQNYIRQKLEKNGYIEVKTPIIIDKDLWVKSGHWDKFHDNMFVINHEDEHSTLAIKPMNCPGHVQIFNQSIRSYKDLPIKMAEFGTCNRNEPSGSLHGVLRTREFVQDDAHIFCTESQLKEEVVAFCTLLLQVYKEMGFVEVTVKFADRPKLRAGSDAVWDKAEKALMEAVQELDLDYTFNYGEGAFYGPKLEFILKDCLGRNWQCGTLQVDFVLPERLGASYIASDGQKHRPVMLHRAILGTFERFIGILLEHYKGALPLWLAPVQVIVVNITDATRDYAVKVNCMLKARDVRSRVDIRNEKLSYKIREHSLNKVPFIFVVGSREQSANQVSVKRFGCDKGSDVMSCEDAIALILDNKGVSCQ